MNREGSFNRGSGYALHDQQELTSSRFSIHHFNNPEV